MFSLGQDIIYAATNGNIKTSKHVTLGMALKSLSSSRKIVDLVNKYGHCCSYNVIEELETELTFTSTQQNKLCPEDIILADNLCTGVAFDNFDRFVDTLTGKDTLHDTVGIIYQNIPSDANFTAPTDASVQSDDTAAASTDETPRRRKRRRCFDAIVNDIVPYTKKPKIDSYFSTPSIGQISIKPEVFQTWRNLDLAWLFSHTLDIPDTPMWTGFNSLITEDTSALQKVSYLTPINASPTNNSVVHLTLKMAQQIAEECSSKYMQVTYDLAIARIAFGIQFQEAPKFDNVFIHLGGFHIMMSYFKVIGSFIEDCGITHILVDSEILANGSLKGFISGTNFNRCKRLHPLVSLAFQKLHFNTFVDREKIVIEKSIEDYLFQLQKQRLTTPTIEHEATLELLEKYDNFTEQTLRGKHGLTAQFYTVYIRLVSYYDMLNKSIRTGDLKMYVYILAKITNFFFAFNHQNYSRWLVYYVSKLCRIDETHPGLRFSLEQGSFGVRRTEKSFSRIPVDLTLEQTINGEAARKLIGIIHMTNSVAARQRWAINHSARARIISHVLKTAGLAKNQDITSELKSSRIRKSHQQVEKFTRTLQQYMNPFDNSLDADKLYNITTGEAAAQNITDFLLNVESRGETLRNNFITEVEERHARFNEPIKKNPVFTFSTVKKKKKVVLGGKVQELRLQRDLFGRLLALSLEKKISIEKVLCYPITPMPLSLCHMDGTINKTDKSALMRDLEKKIESTEPESTDVLIIDGFFLLHTLKDIPRTFGDISKKILHILCKHNVERIDLIFDRYFCPSIKDTEHGLRKNVKSTDFRISGPQQVRPSDFAKELKNIKFKDALVKFIINNWSEQDMAHIIANKIININHDMCYEYSVKDGFVIQTINEDLTCQEHEEADTKIVYHVCQMKQRGKVTIRCSDTDILIIMLGNMEFVESDVQISMDVGVGNSRRYIDVSRLYETLGSTLAKSLPAFHAMTGCDYNPALYHKGKKRPLTMLKNSKRYQEAFGDLGSYTSDSDKIFPVLEEFTCRLYNEKKINNVDLARLNIFSKTYKIKNDEASTTLNLQLSNYDACNLPPCKTELEKHLLRTKYIAQVWSNAHTKTPTELNPADCGWYEDEGRFQFSWFSGNQLPELSDVILDDKPSSTTEEDVEDLPSDVESDFEDDDSESDSD
ncbi:uncharacterized protein LOC121736526 [Aricia agestis]|uniref:uncharacterized protein LOC121734581 n=1 Tax=Aricia agestis TaxID=91739 RepID=UPI001C2069E3|nr:uncharacterized protein LOC121734581 [Aricia agestis]XP_041983076.1 uncharacterized protein LOC121736084 [Aricia agestis]XP_041983712.1 uncharacterized protein LOC121736526 [Aricia agestis]